MKTPDKLCPLCDCDLASQPGTQLDITDGITVYCPNVNCLAQEVFGHGKNEREALEIIHDRYSSKSNFCNHDKRKNRTNN